MKRPYVVLAFLTFCLVMVSCVETTCRGMISWREYLKNYNRARGPYVLELDTERGGLLYYGALHTVNHLSPQFGDIEKRWQGFKPTLALCEGGIWPLEKTRYEAIKQHGEQGLLRYLAARDNVRVLCLEPRKVKEVNFLIANFSAEKIKVYYILRRMLIHRMLNKDKNNIRYVSWILRGLSKIYCLKGSPATFKEFEIRIASMFPELKNWRDMPYYYLYGRGPKKWLKEIHRRVNSFRNECMAKKLIARLRKGERVFAIAGRSHVAIQEPVIRKVVDD